MADDAPNIPSPDDASHGEPPDKKKLPKWERIARGEDPHNPWRIMSEYIAAYHKHLEPVKIELVWRRGWKVNRWGNLTLGKTMRAKAQDRLLHRKHFIIALNKEAWDAADFSQAQKEHLIDHELQHCFVETDDDDKPVKDDEGQFKLGVRQHDVEEFYAVVRRHGGLTEELRQFAVDALNEQRTPPLFKTGGKKQRPADRATRQRVAASTIVNEWMEAQSVALAKDDYRALVHRISDALDKHHLPVFFDAQGGGDEA